MRAVNNKERCFWFGNIHFDRTLHWARLGNFHIDRACVKFKLGKIHILCANIQYTYNCVSACMHVCVSESSLHPIQESFLSGWCYQLHGLSIFTINLALCFHEFSLHSMIFIEVYWVEGVTSYMVYQFSYRNPALSRSPPW